MSLSSDCRQNPQMESLETWPSGWVERRLCQEDGEPLKLTEVARMPPELTPLLSVRAGDMTGRSSASDHHLVTVGEATANDVKVQEDS